MNGPGRRHCLLYGAAFLCRRAPRAACAISVLLAGWWLLAPGPDRPNQVEAAEEVLSDEELGFVRAAERDRIRVVKRVVGTVVAIFGSNRQGGGSGVLFDPDGYALTNHHVVAAAGPAGWAGLADGKLYRWTLIGTDPGGDIAIIRLAGKDKFPASPLGDSRMVAIGDPVMAMGNPFILAEDYYPTVTLGVVSGVERYQAGSGKNMLVYGNCIQTDTSISPGNSGGPLFNMRGEVVGINGRISLKERGRVNVGVGYAVSMEQIKNFLPDLLATKLTQHGTLDAQFSNRRAGVICDAINRDSRAYRRGLRLGDRLIEFQGEPIRDANHFTNLISMLPAQWPAHLVYERDGARHDLRVRLTGLAYGQPRPQPGPRERPAPEKKGDEQPERKPSEEEEAEKAESDEKAGDEKSADEKDAEGKDSAAKDADKQDAEKEDSPKEGDETEGQDSPEGKPPEKPAAPTRPPNPWKGAKPGTIVRADLNQVAVRMLLDRWKAFVGTSQLGEDAAALRIRDDVFRDGKQVGDHELIVDRDGRFRAEWRIDGRGHSLICDGTRFLALSGDKGEGARDVSREEALAGPFALQAAVMGSLFQGRPLTGLGEVTLEGGDLAAGRRSYRFRVAAEGLGSVWVWLSVFDDEGRPQARLLKTGHALDGSSRRPSLTYGDYRNAEGIQVPHRRRLVAGLAETPDLEIRTRECELLATVPEDLFLSEADDDGPRG